MTFEQDPHQFGDPFDIQVGPLSAEAAAYDACLTYAMEQSDVNAEDVTEKLDAVLDGEKSRASAGQSLVEGSTVFEVRGVTAQFISDTYIRCVEVIFRPAGSEGDYFVASYVIMEGIEEPQRQMVDLMFYVLGTDDDLDVTGHTGLPEYHQSYKLLDTGLSLLVQ